MVPVQALIAGPPYRVCSVLGGCCLHSPPCPCACVSFPDPCGGGVGGLSMGHGSLQTHYDDLEVSGEGEGRDNEEDR